MRAFLITIAAAATIGVLAATSGADTRLAPDTTERILAVIGGSFATRAEAVAAADAMPFGDVQGFYVAASDDFDGEEPGRFLLVTAFRTDAGAAAFEELARVVGLTELRRALTRYRGTEPIGLGQEADPSGMGPLLGPLQAGHPLRL